MATNEAPKPKLTQRELEVLQLAWDGFSAAEIGKRLSISAKTVEFHRNEIYKKLDAHNVVTAIRKALQYGMLDL